MSDPILAPDDQKYMSLNSLRKYHELHNTELNVKFDEVSDTIANLEENIITLDGGATATVADIFGVGPYVIEFTNDEGEIPVVSNEIEYNNGASGLKSTDVQGAIDELKELTTTAVSGTDYGTFRIRNVAILSELPKTMNDGDIVLIYKP